MSSVNVHISLIIILVISIFWIWNMTCNHPVLVRKSFDTLNFKTGDIILFHAYDNINPIFIGSYWGHIGIVYKNPDKSEPPLLFEAARTTGIKNCPDYNKHGIMITDLKTRLEKYPGMIACKFLNKPLRYEMIKGFYEFMQYSKKNMYYNDNVFQSCFKKMSGDELNVSTNCGELVTLSLIKLGLIPINTLKKKIAHHLLYMVNIIELQDNNYLKPIEITFNPF